MSATGADLPPEILSQIIKHLDPMITSDMFKDKIRRLRQGLAACSLVCRHWSNVISPMLFEYLRLSSTEDALFLRNALENARTSRPFLLDNIHIIWIKDNIEESTQASLWLHHVHPLVVLLPKTSFRYFVEGKADGAGPTVSSNPSAVQARRVYSPLRSLSRIPPLSSLRLTHLGLNWLQFASKTELARFIDSFPTLKQCRCDQLTFVDLSPITRRRQRRSSPSLDWCRIWQCDGTALTTQATLASDILRAPAHLALDGDKWSTVLQALVALAPQRFDNASMELSSGDEQACVAIRFAQSSTYTPGNDAIWATVYAFRPDATADPQPLPAFVGRIELGLSLATSYSAVKSMNFDVLRAIVDSPQFSRLVLAYGGGPKPSHEYETLKTILRFVLERKQLAWALESRKLQVETPWEGEIVTSSDILSASAEHTLGDATITLDINEQVEWLLRFMPDAREEYLRYLATDSDSES